MAFIQADLIRVKLNPTGNEREDWLYITQDGVWSVGLNGYFPHSSGFRKHELVNILFMDPNDKKILQQKIMYRVVGRHPHNTNIVWLRKANRETIKFS